MDLNDLLQMGAKVFRDSNLSGTAGSNLDIGDIASALSGLTGSSGGFDLNSLIDNLGASGLGDVAKSWLGNGANQAISPEQIGNAVGSDQLSDFASKLGISFAEASGGLADALPQMVDKASPDGSLLEAFGGVEGVIGLASKLFK